MMTVEIHNHLKFSERLQATRVVVYDEFENPISVTIKVDGGHYIAITPDHKRFKELLSVLGINKTLVIDKIDTNKLPKL